MGSVTGREEYLYAEVNVWQTILPDGMQIFHYASGQTEAHRNDGSKEACSPQTLPYTDVQSHVALSRYQPICSYRHAHSYHGQPK